MDALHLYMTVSQPLSLFHLYHAPLTEVKLCNKSLLCFYRNHVKISAIIIIYDIMYFLKKIKCYIIF